MIAVMLADDHAILREGVRILLEADPGVRVVAQVGDGTEVLPAVEQARPDVLVLDLQLPGLSGLEVLRRLQQAAPATRVLVLSMYAAEAYVLQAVRYGALGYVLKGASFVELLDAIKRVAAGERYLSPPLSALVVEAYAHRTDPTSIDLYETLTAREREVLRWTAEGLTNAQVAERLFISPRTVEAHRASLLRKLQLHTQTDLVRYALRRGLIDDATAHNN